MRYQILHDLPGRMRVHCGNVRLNPDFRLELDRWVEGQAGLESAVMSMRTGNLLIRYSKGLTRASLLVMLDDLQLFGVTTMVYDDASGQASLTGVVCAACARETALFFCKSLPPAPVQAILAGWKMAARGVDLFQKFVGGEIASFRFGVVKWAVLAIVGKSLPLRLLFLAACTAIRHFSAEQPIAGRLGCADVGPKPVPMRLPHDDDTHSAFPADESDCAAI